MGMVDQERASRLQMARKAAGFSGPGEAAAALGARSKFTYTQHENGRRGFPVDKALQYARRFGVRLEWLLRGTGPMKDNLLVPVVGYVGAGAEVFPEDAHPKGQGLDMVDAPPDGATDCVAVKIRGDSMYPLGDGWLIFYRRHQEGVPDDCLNKLCIVRVHDDGPTLLKTLKRGRAPKLWTLESWNAPARENVRLDWAARVLDIRPR